MSICVGFLDIFVLDTENKILKDGEIQDWCKVLSTPSAGGGVGVKVPDVCSQWNTVSFRLGLTVWSVLVLTYFQGVPEDGALRTTDDVVMLCTAIIYTCSAQHAAVNFGQYDHYSYFLNCPSILTGQPPMDKVQYFFGFPSQCVYLRINFLKPHAREFLA